MGSAHLMPFREATVVRPDFVLRVVVTIGARGFSAWNSSTNSCVCSISDKLIQESSSRP